VVAELTENIAGWGRIKSALDEIRACHEDTLTFFIGALEHLDLLCGSLASRQQHIENQSATQRDIITASEATDDNRWDMLQKKFEEDRTEFSDIRQTVQQQIAQLTAVSGDLARTRNEFQTVRGELVRHSEELTAVRSQMLAAPQEVESNVQNKIRDMEQQQSLLEKERAAMEAELQSARNRAAEKEELLAEQKRSADLLESNWVEEFREMRQILEALARPVAESKRQIESTPTVTTPSGVAAVALGDPVLESVLAQFEILQQDRLNRRLETAESTKKNTA